MFNTGYRDVVDEQTYFHGWDLGIVFGKANKKGTWEFSYDYRWLGANAWYEEFVDDDFGGIYWQTPATFANNPLNISTAPGINATPDQVNPNGSYYISGTNVKGHIFRFAYCPTDSVTMSLKLFLTDLIRHYPKTSNGSFSRIQVDVTAKF